MGLKTSRKMEILLGNADHTQQWLAEQWGITQPSISKKFKENNWKESDLRKFCEALNLSYEVVFTDSDGKKY